MSQRLRAMMELQWQHGRCVCPTNHTRWIPVTPPKCLEVEYLAGIKGSPSCEYSKRRERYKLERLLKK